MRSWLNERACCIGSGAGCLVLAATVLFPVVFQPPGRPRRVECQSNLRQIALAARMYAEDYDERLNPALRWMDLLDPYVKSDSLYRCPTLSKSDPAAYGYAYNRRLSKLLPKQIPQPDSTPLQYDTDQRMPSASDDVTSLPHPGRHNGGNNIAFADGHVKRVPDRAPVIPLPR